MNIESVRLTHDQAGLESIMSHLKAVDEAFVPKLSSYVDLLEYSRKLKEKSNRIELWHKERLVGLLAFYLNDRSVFISNVSLEKHLQNSGFGKRMIDELFELCKVKCINVIELEVNVANTKAINFYYKAGFVTKEIIGDILLLINIQ